MKPIPIEMQVTLHHAIKFYAKVVEFCIRQLESADDRNLVEIGCFLGDIVNNLRSALNYAAQDFARSRLRTVLSAAEFKKARGWRGRLDFPYGRSKSEFDNRDLVKRVAQHFGKVYQFWETEQPYHPGKEWLGFLMKISNVHKHEITAEVFDRGIRAFAFPDRSGVGNQEVSVFGDKVMVRRPGRSPLVYQTPCFLETCHLFASKDGPFVLFLINVDNNKLGLTRFVEQACDGVRRLLSDFYSLF